MQTTAKLRHLRMSPRKVRLVADVIRGLNVINAVNQLSFMNKKATLPILKLLNSAVANAENNSKHSGLKRSNLYISELRVDEGPTLKRWMPRAMGRATPINKRTSHITIVLDEKVKDEKTEKKEKRAISDQESSGKDKKKDKKIDKKDVKIVKSLDEVKKESRPVPGQAQEIKNQELSKDKKDKDRNIKEESIKEIKDIRREGSDRGKQHLDAVKKKGKGGVLKRVFRRKSI